MQIESTGFDGLLIIHPRVFADDRGYFFESYNEEAFLKNGLQYHWVQDNQSHSKHGVIRGLHFQKSPYGQSKLVRVLKGEILDIVVDLRTEQPTFGKVFSVLLSSENRRQLLIPKGFAHGFSVLSESAEVLYKCDAFYNKESEWGILYNDPALNIDWGIGDSEYVVSEKDKELPHFKDLPPLF
jgi:dTDP-4-dehydrorhamnose 3,5-epimerase